MTHFFQDGDKKVNRSLCLFGDGRVRDFFVSKSHKITFFFHQAIALEGLTHVLLKFDSKWGFFHKAVLLCNVALSELKIKKSSQI